MVLLRTVSSNVKKRGWVLIYTLSSKQVGSYHTIYPQNRVLGLTKHCILKTGLVLINTVSSIQKVESYYTMYPQNRLCPTTHLFSKYRLGPTTHCILKTDASAFYNLYHTKSGEGLLCTVSPNQVGFYYTLYPLNGD